jgi:hypothetical protein
MVNTRSSPLGTGIAHVRLIVSAIPVPNGEDRVFTMEVEAFLRKEAGRNRFAKYQIQCVMAGNVRWPQSFKPPRLGKWITVME